MQGVGGKAKKGMAKGTKYRKVKIRKSQFILRCSIVVMYFKRGEEGRSPHLTLTTNQKGNGKGGRRFGRS